MNVLILLVLLLIHNGFLQNTIEVPNWENPHAWPYWSYRACRNIYIKISLDLVRLFGLTESWPPQISERTTRPWNKKMQWSAHTFKPTQALPHIHKSTYFEAGGDGGIFIVGCLCVPNKIIPAGEHLPGKGELTVFSVPSPHICVFSHPNSESGLYSTLVENPISPAG